MNKKYYQTVIFTVTFHAVKNIKRNVTLLPYLYSKLPKYSKNL